MKVHGSFDDFRRVIKITKSQSGEKYITLFGRKKCFFINESFLQMEISGLHSFRCGCEQEKRENSLSGKRDWYEYRIKLAFCSG